jgi:diaminohydroxyphosphoribosylaminopyrimidine deaminase/5-amino-6-(5-phosphoribosylamino)uracil reductase
LRVPLASAVVGTARETPTWVVCTAGASSMAEEVLRAKGVEVLRVGAHDGRLELGEVLRALAERGITRLMVEGGPIIAASFVEADLIDEAALFRSPDSLGADAIDALEGLPLAALTRSPHLKPLAREPVGRDTVELFERT